jgi:hypothetical protein
MNLNEKFLNAAEVYNLMRQNLPIQNVSVNETVDLIGHFSDRDLFPYGISFINSNINDLKLTLLMFNKHVLLKNCIFNNADFYASYFLGGLTIDNCTFENGIHLMTSGGHNKPLQKVIIKNTMFKGFVDMSDAWFEGPIEISGCIFIKGSNLLGNIDTPIQVKFDYKPTILNNSGKLDINDFNSK